MTDRIRRDAESHARRYLGKAYPTPFPMVDHQKLLTNVIAGALFELEARMMRCMCHKCRNLALANRKEEGRKFTMKSP